jgi:hypothetical protein
MVTAAPQWGSEVHSACAYNGVNQPSLGARGGLCLQLHEPGKRNLDLPFSVCSKVSVMSRKLGLLEPLLSQR